MTIIGHLVIFLIAWLLTFFIVLPWGRTGHHDGGEDCRAASPVKAKMGRKLLITTGIAVVIWAIFWAVAAFHLISVS
ncbi:MAG: DUF1467 family protein [Alphaproteobacteria bacterium]|nr:DUF1467 family protein [Alphaproteobacteria bacterium]